MKMFTYVLLFLSLTCHGQDHETQLLEKYISRAPTSIQSKIEGFAKSSTKVVDYLPNNYSKKGKINYREQVQKALDKGGIILMPAFPILIDSKGLFIKSNTTLVFEKGSKLIMKPNAETHYALLHIQSEKNIEIYSASLEGDRESHLINKGEWGMGINILGSENIKLYAPEIINSWGDGIYIGAVGKTQSKNIEIHYPMISHARRNGISITSGENVLIKGGVIAYTGGTAPQSGIDVEPNRPHNVVDQIKLENITTFKNKGDGIMLSLSPLTLKENRPRNHTPEVNIEILNHVDIKSFGGLRINGRLKDSEKYDNSKISGAILIQQPIWIANDVPIRFSPRPDRILEYGFNPTVRLVDVSVLDEVGQKVKDHQKIVNEAIAKSKVL